MKSQSDTINRRLAAILAADATNYSGLVAQDEETALRVLAGHRTAIDAAILSHSGRIFATAGDSVLAEFASPVQAVRAAIEIQSALRERNASSGLAAAMHFRIGVNVGDVVVDGDNILGDGVNIAVRLENLAPPGGICISANVRDHVAGKLECRLQDLGTQFLKNIPRPVRAFQLIDDARGPALPLGVFNSSRRVTIGAAAALLLLALAAWLTANGPTPAPKPEAVAQPRAKPAPSRDELMHWESVKQSADPAEIRTYLAKYPRGAFAELAQTRLSGILAAESRQVAIKDATAKMAEAERAQQDAAQVKNEADSAVARATAEQHTAARLRAEADQATARAAAAAKNAAEAQQKLSRSQNAAGPLLSDRIALVRTISPMDGHWSADFSCDVSAEQPATTLRLSAYVQYREIRIEHGTVGLPGYFRAYGSIAEDGSFQLLGTSLPRTQRIVGVEDAVQANGRTADLDHMEATGTIGKRRCALALTRVAAQ